MNGVPKLGNTLYFSFTTRHPDTGAMRDSDPPPTCKVYEGTTNIAILNPTVVRVAAGHYCVPVEATADNGFGVGRSYNVLAEAAVKLTARGIVGQFALVADGASTAQGAC